MDLRHGMLALCLSVTLALLAPSGSGAGEPRHGGTLRIGYVQDMTGLDPHTSGHVFQTLVAIVRASRLAALIATHNMDLAGKMDRRVTIREGQVVQLP